MVQPRYSFQPVSAPVGYLRRGEEAPERERNFNAAIASASSYLLDENRVEHYWIVTLRWEDPAAAEKAVAYFRDLIHDYIADPATKRPRLVPDVGSKWLCLSTFLAMRRDGDSGECEDVRICTNAFPWELGSNTVTFCCDIPPREITKSGLALARTIMRVTKEHHAEKERRREASIGRPPGM